MEWGIIQAITALVSAVGDLMAIELALRQSRDKRRRVGRGPKYLALSFSWALLCLCCLWIFQPYSPEMTEEEHKQFFGIILALPASLAFISAIRSAGSRNVLKAKVIKSKVGERSEAS